MDEDIGPSIGAQLRRIRVWRGLSLRACAQLAGFSAPYMSMIENGKSPVDKRSTLEAFANALRVSPSELTGSPYPSSTDATDSEAHASISAVRFALSEREMSDPPPRARSDHCPCCAPNSTS